MNINKNIFVMASLIKKCQVCNQSFNYTYGAFTLHLTHEHNLLLKDYVIQYELDNKLHKCKCGYCNEEPPFVRGKFLTVIDKHETYKWINEQYINKNGNAYKLEDNVHKMITDFSINNYEIEIKSSWILKKQGGIKKLNEKRKAVELTGKQYIFILDKDYSEFLEIIERL